MSVAAESPGCPPALSISGLPAPNSNGAMDSLKSYIHQNFCMTLLLYNLGLVPDFSDSSLLHQYHQNTNSNL